MSSDQLGLKSVNVKVVCQCEGHWWANIIAFWNSYWVRLEHLTDPVGMQPKDTLSSRQQEICNTLESLETILATAISRFYTRIRHKTMAYLTWWT